MPTAAPAGFSYFTLLGAVAPVFAVIACGFLVRRVRWLTADADRSLLRVTINLLTPCLIFDSVLGNPAVQNPGNVILAPVVGFVTIVASYLAVLACAGALKITGHKQRRTFAFSAGLQNYGYIPLPLIQFLFVRNSPAAQDTTAVLFAHNLGVETALWTVGVMLLTSGSGVPLWRRVINVPSCAILSALLLNFLGAKDWVPAPLLAAAHTLGASAIPLGLLLTGASFADQMRGNPLRSGLNIALGSLVLRLALLPAALLLLARFLPCPVELKRVLVLQAAMPAAMAPVILSRHFDGDPGVAFNVVLCTTVAGLLTIPFWLALGMRLVL
jgi:malate permease and related proteins